MQKRKLLLDSARLIRVIKSTDGVIRHDDSEGGFIKHSFYTYGFFDELTYIKPHSEKYLSYKNCLGIEYPCKNENVSAEQLFCIYGGSAYSKNYEVFESTDKSKPFLGIILASINKIDETNFEFLTETIIENLIGIFDGKNYSAEVYKTLNCADLCIAVRTDSFEDIYTASVAVKEYFNENQIQFNITTIQCVSNNVDTLSTEIYNSNSNVLFDLRVADKADYDSYEPKGILGIGGKVVRLSFKDYFDQIFPLFIKRKYNSTSSIDIVHERIFFDNVAKIKTSSSGCKTVNNDKKLSYINKLRKDLAEIEQEVEHLENCRYQIEEEVLLIHELINTFCDLWFQYTSVNGYIFYVQCSLLFDGIRKCIESIKKATSEDSRIYLCKILKYNSNKSINCINNYNKMLQYLNQDSVNYPTHEVHAKVNTEKYLLAYTAYLHNICKDFYDEYNHDKSENLRKILPIALFDMNADEISVFTLFDKETAEFSDERLSLYAAIFPTYRRFANIRHVLPLLTHELSHEFRYMERHKRNKAIVDYLIEDFSNRIVRELLKESEIKTLTINGLQIFLSQSLCSSLKTVLFNNDYSLFDSWHMHEFPVKLSNLIEKQILSFTDRTSDRIAYNTNKKSLLTLNCDIASEHVKELYNWLYQKKQDIGEISSDSTNIDLIVQLTKHKKFISSFKSNTDEEILFEGYLNLYTDVNNVLKVLYADLYDEFHSHISDISGFSYEQLQFTNARLILTEIQNFYKSKISNNTNATDSNNERLIKFCEDIIDITLRLNIIGEASPITTTDTEQVDKNLNAIFSCLHNSILACSNTGSEYHIYFRSTKYRNIFTTMGLYNDESDVFVSLLKKVLYRINGDINTSFKDKIRCYGEICADLGMCAAFNFTAFGYIRFLTHIFEQEKFGMWERGKSLTVDRVNTVLKTLLISECCKDSTAQSLAECRENFNKLKRDLCFKLAEYVGQKFQYNTDDPSPEFYDNINQNIRFMEKYINKLNVFDIQFSDTGIQKHYNDLYENISAAKWVENCQKDSTVNAIGDYYNISKITVEEENKYLSFFEHHMEFVFKYYCKHRNFYNKLINTIDDKTEILSINECMDILF